MSGNLNFKTFSQKPFFGGREMHVGVGNSNQSQCTDCGKRKTYIHTFPPIYVLHVNDICEENIGRVVCNILYVVTLLTMNIGTLLTRGKKVATLHDYGRGELN